MELNLNVSFHLKASIMPTVDAYDHRVTTWQRIQLKMPSHRMAGNLPSKPKANCLRLPCTSSTSWNRLALKPVSVTGLAVLFGEDLARANAQLN